jgi:Predicted membrane protein
MMGLRAKFHPRLLMALLIGTAVALILSAIGRPSLNSRILIGWDAGVVAYLATVGLMAFRSSIGQMRRRASLEDEGALATLVLTLSAAIASLAAIAVELQGTDGSENTAFRLSVAGVTIICSWFFVHMIFAVHYAHEFYGDEGERGGLQFPQTPEPDYWDFMYYAFNLGAAAQTSDVLVVSKRMRRLTLAHTILSFLFNTTVLALAVNVGAGLI